MLRRVEHVDTDAAGVVHFTRYASLLETAVLENLEDLGLGIHRLAQEGLEPAVVEVQMRYSAPARFLDSLRVRVHVEGIRASSCKLGGEIGRLAPGHETVLAVGALTMCVVRRPDGLATALPGWFREVLREYRDGETDG